MLMGTSVKYSFSFIYEFHWVRGNERSSFKISFVLFCIITFSSFIFYLFQKMTVINDKALIKNIKTCLKIMFIVKAI